MNLNNTSNALTEHIPSNIIQFEIIHGSQQKKEIKYNKDGTIKRTHNNKVAGKDSEVYAFKTKEEIDDMINVFDKHIAEATNEDQKRIACRNKLLFLIGINIGIRASDLRTLKFSFFLNEDMSFKDYYVLQPMKQRKQKKFVKLFFNQSVRIAINNYIAQYPIEDLDDYLFQSRKGYEAITVQALWDIVKSAAKEAGIKDNIGSHSLRKTFGYWCWHNAEDKNKALVILQQCFNHSSTQTTAKYIGLLDDEIEEMYNSIELGLELIQ